MRRFRPALSTVASALAHALVLAWLLHLPKPAEPRHHEVVVEVDLVRPPPPPKPAPELPKPAPPTPKRASAPHPQIHEQPRPPVPAEPPPAVAEPVAPPPDAPRAPVVDVPRRELVLTPRADSFPVAPLPPEPDAPPARTDAEVVKSMLAEGQAKARVERGAVDPYFLELGKKLVDGWDADTHVQAHGLKGYVDQTVENTRTFAKIWSNRAEAYGKTGSPMGDLATPTTLARAGSADDSLVAKQAYRQQVKEQFRSTRRATIKLVQEKDGRLVSVSLVSPSNDAWLDKMALEDLRKMAEKLPPPPKEGLGIGERIVSLWSFELIVSISPPIPSVEFEFDEALKFVDMRMPLDRRIYKRVRLVAVE